MRMLLIFTSVFALMIASGCGSSGDPAGPGPTGNYFPMASGDYWEYAISGQFALFGTTYELTGYAKREVVGTATHDDGFNMFRVRTEEIVILLEGGTPVDTLSSTWENFFRVESAQVTIYESTADDTAEKVLELPLETGNTWSPGSDDPGGHYEVMNLSSQITVPDGVYSDCARVDYTNTSTPNDYIHFYYIPGVGLGSNDIYDDQGDTGSLNYHWDLSSTNY